MTKAQANKLASFNRKYPPGTTMHYRSHPSAEPRIVTVETTAWLLSGHTPVVNVHGSSGCVALDALSPVKS